MPDNLVRHDANTEGRDFAVGDLHGCIDVLTQALKDVDFDIYRDRLFTLGDMVDRGPKNIDTLELIREDWVYPIRGNHDEMLFRNILDGSYPYYQTTYGKWVPTEANTEEEYDRLFHLCYYGNMHMPYAREVVGKSGKRYGLIHAQAPGNNWNLVENYSPRWDGDVRMWGRGQVEVDIDYNDDTETAGIDVVVSGHTPFIDSPLKYANRVYIDTAVWKTKRVNLYELE